MYTQNQLNEILNRIAHEASDIFGDRLHSVILFGSYARGDYDEDSDIDIMLLADVEPEELLQYRRAVNKLGGILLYDYGILVSIVEKDLTTFNRYADVLSFYHNIRREGVKIA
ncbi:MAG: nucleotidyltransferase domain-containing protein [Firmicutes bacterium]|nr:nucleotidyltransferase domain-containing protein [Bacillota bacterium]